MTITTPFPLGRTVEPNHDPRSLNFPAAVDLPVVKKTWRRYGAVLDQGNVGSCTGNALAQSANHTPLRRKGKIYFEADALGFYGRATEIDGYPGTYPGQDTGSDGISVAKAGVEAGVATSYEHAFGLDHAVQALMYGTLLVGTVWTNDMFEPDANGFVRPTGGIAGGHEYVLMGVNPNAKVLTFLNSWSKAWGLSGKFHMTFDSFDTLLKQQGDVVLCKK